MAEISIIDIRQGPVGPAGPAANVTQANIEAAITDKPGFREEIEAVGTDGTGAEASAFREAIAAASSALQIPVESLASATRVHDDCTGDNQTLAAAATRTVAPGPGTMTAGAVPSTSSCRYENGELLLTPMPAGSGQVNAHWGAVTAAAGLTMIARFVPSWTPGRLGQTRVGFSDVTNALRARRGLVMLTTNAPNTKPEVRISTLANSSDDGEYPLDYGTFDAGDEMVVAVHYKTLSHQQYWIQGGRYADAGAVVGSANWHLLGETFTSLSGTVYPSISNNFNGTIRVRDVQVLSSWSPSPRHQAWDYSRTQSGIHIPSFGRDPVTGLVLLAWNNGTAHVDVDSKINYSTKLADGTWTASSTLLPAPGGGAGISVQSLSRVGNALWLIYWRHPTAADGGTLYRAVVTVNPTTGAATLGTEVELGVTGTRNLAFSPILTLPSGRLLLSYHKNDGSPVGTSYVSRSDDDGLTWTEGAVATSFPAGTLNLYEPQLVIESDGAVGVWMRATVTGNVAYYARCADPDATPLVWSTPVPINAIPQPGTNGSRMRVTTLENGQRLLIGNDSKTGRRAITIWEIGDNGAVLGETHIADLLPLFNEGVGGAIMQYPDILQDGDDLLIAYSHNQPGSYSVASSCAIRLHTWRWTEVVAKEAGGSGLRSRPRPPAPTRTLVPAVPITFSPTPTPDMSVGNLFDLRLTASTATVAAPLNPLPWETRTLIVTQAGSGSYTLAFNAVFEFNATTPTLRTAVGASNVFVFRYNGFTNKWVLQSFN